MPGCGLLLRLTQPRTVLLRDHSTISTGLHSPSQHSGPRSLLSWIRAGIGQEPIYILSTVSMRMEAELSISISKQEATLIRETDHYPIISEIKPY